MKDTMESYDPMFDGPLTTNYPDDVIKQKKSYLKNIAELYQMKNFKEMAKLGAEAIDKLPKEPTGEGDRDISDIYLLMATALRELNNEDPLIRQYAYKSANFNRLNKGALWLIRDISREFSDKSAYYVIEVIGKYFAPTTGGPKLMPFKTMYSLVAENPEEGMDMIREFERREVKDQIELSSFEEKELVEELPKGIYSTMRLVIIPQKSED